VGDLVNAVMRRAYLGIDCGTQSTKALLLDASTGKELSPGRADHELISRPDGTREQQPAWWVDAAIGAIRQAIAQAPDCQIAGIGVSGQQHGLVALDSGDKAVRPAKLWNDTTTMADCAALTERMGGEANVHAATGNVFLPGYTAPKIAWMRRVEPELYARAVRFCLPHDWLNLWLTGEFATEAGDASGTAYLDVRRRAYAGAALAAIDDARDWDAALPPINPSNVVMGRLRPEAADLLGVPAGIPVSTGGGDNMCAAIGAGAVVPGIAVISLGTSGTVFGHRDAPAVDPLREVSAFCDSTGGWLPLACVLNCTLLLDWVRRILGVDQVAFDALVETVEPGARGLRCIPYLDGERTPNLPHASGELRGLRLHHGQAELARAALEGITGGLAHALHAFRRTGAHADALLLVGGAARSDTWAQLLADWLEVPITRPSTHEAAARGAAIQAAHVVEGAPLTQPAGTDGSWEPRDGGGIAEVRADYATLIDELR
jgi:xylulokinase